MTLLTRILTVYMTQYSVFCFSLKQWDYIHLGWRYALERQSLRERLCPVACSNLEVVLMSLVCGCALTLNVVSMPLGGATTGCWIRKRKTWGFSPFTGNRINRSTDPDEIWRFSVANWAMGMEGMEGMEWVQETLNFSMLGQLVSTMYLTPAAQNSRLLKIRPQVSSFTRNFTFLRYLGVKKDLFNVLKVCAYYGYLWKRRPEVHMM